MIFNRNRVSEEIFVQELIDWLCRLCRLLSKILNIRWKVPLTLIVLGVVNFYHFRFFCPYLHDNNTALTKQIPLFDTALVMTNT